MINLTLIMMSLQEALESYVTPGTLILFTVEIPTNSAFPFTYEYSIIRPEGSYPDIEELRELLLKALTAHFEKYGERPRKVDLLSIFVTLGYDLVAANACHQNKWKSRTEYIFKVPREAPVAEC